MHLGTASQCTCSRPIPSPQRVRSQVLFHFQLPSQKQNFAPAVHRRTTQCRQIVQAAAAEGESRLLHPSLCCERWLLLGVLDGIFLSAAEIKLGRGRATSAPREDGFAVACAPEQLPKGERKEVTIAGERVLLFWYRNDIIAIEPRSPAEGAYSEGFISAKLTPDNCIECPSTSSLFDLTTGEIKAWYPKNPVLRLLTPRDTVRNMTVYPVKLESEAILVNVGSSSSEIPNIRGGANTSSAGNNIYALQPQTYVQGSTAGSETSPSGAPDKLDGFTVGVALFGFSVTAITGTTISLLNKSYSGLAVFWLGQLFLMSIFALRYFASDDTTRIAASKKK